MEEYNVQVINAYRATLEELEDDKVGGWSRTKLMLLVWVIKTKGDTGFRMVKVVVQLDGKRCWWKI